MNIPSISSRIPQDSSHHGETPTTHISTPQDYTSQEAQRERTARLANTILEMDSLPLLNSTRVFLIPELRAKILTTLDIPDLILSAQVNSSWKITAISAYFQNQLQLSLHAIHFLQAELKKLNQQHTCDSALDTLEQLIQFLTHTPSITHFKDIQCTQTYIQTHLIQSFKTLPPTLLLQIESIFKYERKPHAFVKLIEVAKSYRLLETLPQELDKRPSWQEALNTIAQYNWKAAFSILETFSRGILQDTLEEDMITLLISKGMHSLALQEGRRFQPHSSENYHPGGFSLPLDPEKLLQTYSLQLRQYCDPQHAPDLKTKNDLLIKIVFLHLLLNNLQKAIQTTKYIHNHDDKNALLQLIVNHMFRDGDLARAITFAETTSIISQDMRELLLLTITELCLENGFFNKVLEILEKIPSPLKAWLLSRCAQEMLQVGMLEEAESILTAQNEIERQSEDFEALSTAYFNKGLLEQSLKVVLMIPNEASAERDKQLVKIATIFTSQRQYKKALTTVHHLTNDTTKSISLKAIVTEYLSEERLDEAFLLAKTIPNQVHQTQAFISIFDKLLVISNLDKAQEVASAVPLEPQRSKLLSSLLILQFPRTEKVLELYAMIHMEQLSDTMRIEIQKNLKIVEKGIESSHRQ